MTPHAESYEQFLARIYGDYGEFVKELWIDRGLDKVHPLSWVELDICDYAANGPKTRGILAPRGLGKTHLVAAALSAYRLYRDPNRKILIPSKSHSHAKKIISILRQWITLVPFLQHLQPRPGQVDSATQFQVGPAKESLQPSVTAIGIDGQLEGNRAHTIIPDDVETAGNTETPEAREDLDERVKEFKDILYPERAYADGGAVDPNEIVYVGTYHHEESLYLKLNARGYRFQTWCIQYPGADDDVLNLAPKLREMLDSGKAAVGDPVFHRFNKENILEKQAEGYTRFAMQHMLIASLAKGNRYPLRLSDLIVTDVPPFQAPISVAYGQRTNKGTTALEGIRMLGFHGDRLYEPAIIDSVTAPYTGTKAGIDPSGRGDDKTGLSIVSHLAGFLWVKACLGLPGGTDTEAMDRIAGLLRQHDARDVYLETNMDPYGTYQQLLEAAMRRHFVEPGHAVYPKGWKCSVTPIRATGQKELRIIGTLEPVISGHRLVVDRAVITPEDDEPMENQLQYQISRIRKEKKCLKEDGKLDSLEMAVRAWNTSLGTNQESVRERTRVEQQEEALRKAGILVKPRHESRWFELPV